MNTVFSNSTKGLLLVGCGTTLFSSKSILIQMTFNAGATVDQLMLVRMLLALPIYIFMGIWAWSRLNKKPTLKTFLFMALPGFACYHIASYLDMWALQFLSAGLERIVLFSYPIFVVIFRVMTGNRLAAAQLVGLLIAYLGVILFFLQDIRLHEGTSTMAVLALLLAAVLTAYYMLSSQKYGQAYNSDLFTAVAMGVTGFTIPLHYISAHGMDVSGISREVWMYGALLSIVFTVLASFLLNRGISFVGAQSGSVTGMLGPMITLALASWLLDQPFTLIHFFSVVLTVLGVSLVTHSSWVFSVLKYVKR